MAELSLIESIASRITRGQTSQQIAIDADLDYSYVEQVLASKEFSKTFELIDPIGYTKWAENQADLRIKRQVMAMAREDSIEFYKQAKEIAVNSKELKDKDRLDALLQLMKIAKIGEGEAPQENVVLSKDNLNTILEAWAETN